MTSEYKQVGPYRTRDIKLASILLACGHGLTGLQYKPTNNYKQITDKKRQRTNVLFEFDMNEELNKVIIQFNSRQLMIDAATLLDCFHSLKSMVSNANYQDFEDINKVTTEIIEN